MMSNTKQDSVAEQTVALAGRGAESVAAPGEREAELPREMYDAATAGDEAAVQAEEEAEEEAVEEEDERGGAAPEPMPVEPPPAAEARQPARSGGKLSLKRQKQ